MNPDRSSRSKCFGSGAQNVFLLWQLWPTSPAIWTPSPSPSSPGGAVEDSQRVLGITRGGNLCSSGCPWGGRPSVVSASVGCAPCSHAAACPHRAGGGVARKQYLRQDETPPSPPALMIREGYSRGQDGFRPLPPSPPRPERPRGPLLSQLYGRGHSARRSLSWEDPCSTRNLLRAGSAGAVGVIRLNQFFLPNQLAHGCVSHQLQALLVLEVVPSRARLWSGREPQKSCCCWG